MIFYGYYSETRREKVCFLAHNTLVLQVKGQFSFETAVQTVSMKSGEMLLIGKNQLGQLIKKPLPPDEHYETIVIALQEDLLRKMVLEEQIVVKQKYTGPSNIHIPGNEFLQGFFQSIVPYVRNPPTEMLATMGILKVKEVVKLLLHTKPCYCKMNRFT